MSRPVTIVVLCWNRWSLTERCLETLRPNTDLSRDEVLVVDNGSTDETSERLKSYPWVRVLTNPQNLGFVRGNNAGIAAAPPDNDVLLLNNDVEILEPGWLERLRAAAYSAPDVGVVGCRLRLPDGRLLHAGTFIAPETCWGQQIGALENDVNQFAADREVEGIVFACAYLRRETLDAIGGLSEAFESYFEDTDYCLRAREAGFRTLVCGGMTLIHHEHGSTSDTPEVFDGIFQKSRAEFRRLWKAKLEARYEYPVHWQSVVNLAHPYGPACRETLRALDGLGVLVSYANVYGEAARGDAAEPENTGDYLLNVIRDRAAGPEPEISVVSGREDVFGRGRGRYRIGYALGGLAGAGAGGVAQHVDELWVSSRFDRDALARRGVSRPVHVMPPGVDVDRFHPAVRSFPNPHGQFVFLARCRWDERDAPGELLQVFNETFRRTEPVVLVCAIEGLDGSSSLRRDVDSLGLRPSGGRVAVVPAPSLPEHELAAYLRSFDCLVSAGHAVDTSFVLKAMACGLPVIATDHGAAWDLLAEERSYPLRVRQTLPVPAAFPDDTAWAEPDRAHLATLLRHAFENREEAREKGRRAAEDVAARWSWRAAAGRMKDRLDEIARTRGIGRPPRPPQPSSTPRRPCIAIDVSRAIGVEVSGVGRYALNVVRGLAEHGPDDFDVLLLPGLGTYVHPEYGRTFTLRSPARARFSVYDGRLPAFSGPGSAPRADLLHSTAYMAPETDVPLLVTVHDLSFVTHPEHHTAENVEFCGRNLERALARGATFIAVSESTRGDLVRLFGADPARVHVVPNTFDERVFGLRSEREKELVRERYGLPERFFLFLASLEPRKNLLTALEALGRVDVGLPLVVAGASGWKRAGIDEAIARAGDRVLRIGYVEQEDLGSLYAAATALVYPSLYEGFGLPVLEAFACGTPVVTSNVSSLPEVAGDAAILLDDPLDAEALGHAMRRLAEDGDLCQLLVGRGLARAKRFSLERVTGELVSVYGLMSAASAAELSQSTERQG